MGAFVRPFELEPPRTREEAHARVALAQSHIDSLTRSLSIAEEEGDTHRARNLKAPMCAWQQRLCEAQEILVRTETDAAWHAGMERLRAENARLTAAVEKHAAERASLEAAVRAADKRAAEAEARLAARPLAGPPDFDAPSMMPNAGRFWSSGD